MKVNGQHIQTISGNHVLGVVEVIDQTLLPFAFVLKTIKNYQEMVVAIQTMQVRGAPLIGAAAAYGIALAASAQADLAVAANVLKASRPTAVNLAWAVDRVMQVLSSLPAGQKVEAAWHEADKIAQEDVLQNKRIAQHGLALIKDALALRERQANMQRAQLNILTHCNAGWLATVDYGTALAPIYAAHDAGLPVHVWVDETRPRNQGASLTAWELAAHGVPHTVIADNAGGHLMQHGQVDMVIVGADRVTRTGDVCNKIGTYLKALAAYDNQIPFYAAVPSPTIDWHMRDGMREIPIEIRDADEVAYMQGISANGYVERVRVIPHESEACNPAFDVTPARLVTGIITEHGVFAPQQLQEMEHA